MKKLIILVTTLSSVLNAYIDHRLEEAVKTSKIEEVRSLLPQAHLTKNEQKALLIIANRRATDLKLTVDQYTKPTTEYETTEYDYSRNTYVTKTTEKKTYPSRRTDIHFVPPHDEGLIALLGLGGVAGLFGGGYLLKHENQSGSVLVIPGVIALIVSTYWSGSNSIAYRQQLQKIYHDALDIEVEIQKTNIF